MDTEIPNSQGVSKILTSAGRVSPAFWALFFSWCGAHLAHDRERIATPKNKISQNVMDTP